jgi:hypothetical protein
LLLGRAKAQLALRQCNLECDCLQRGLDRVMRCDMIDSGVS